jgi:ribosomal protein S18
MIISISARCKAGKTTLADQLVPLGYKKISFADKLKSLVSELYKLNPKDLTDVVKKEQKLAQPLIWNKVTADKLAKMVKATKSLYHEDKTFNSIRDAMQIIGTEILRKYDNNFHVKEFAKQINDKDLWTCDDARFVNEHETLKELGAMCLFVIRPDFDIYYNHDSETNLKRSQFEYVIVNNGTKGKFIKTFNKLINGIGKFDLCRKDILTVLEATKFNITAAAKILGYSVKYVKAMKDAYLINEPDTEYNGLFLTKTEESTKWFQEVIKDGKITKSHGKKQFSIVLSDKVKKFKDAIECENLTTDELVIRSPYFIDDLKLWDYA